MQPEPSRTTEDAQPAFSAAGLLAVAAAFDRHATELRDRYGRGAGMAADQRLLLRYELMRDIAESIRSANAQALPRRAGDVNREAD